MSSSSSRSSQCSPGRYRCCLQGLNGDISLDDGPTKETLESTDTSNYEDKTENSNAKDTDKGKKLIDSGIKMCPIDSENDKEPLEDLSSVLSENKNSGKTEESQPVRGDSGSEMCQIDSENNKEQLEDLSSELSENKYSEKTEESEPVRGDSGGEMCPIDSQNNERQLEDISSVFSVNEISGKTKESQPVDSGGEMCLIDSQKYERQLEALSSEFSENEISEKTEKSQTQTVDCGGKMCPIDKEGDNLTLEYAPNLQDDLSILMDGSSGYASGIQIMSVELARHDNHGDTDNVGGSSGGNNMVGNAMEHRPDPSSIQEYDQLNQLLNNTQGVDHIVKPDSFDFNRVQDESYDQYHSIGQVAYEQENYCDQQFSRVQRSSSSSGITLPCPEHDGRSQRSTFTDSLQKQETFPTEDVVDANITNTHINKKECILDTDSEKCSNQWTPFSSMNSVTHIEEDIYRKHPVSKLPKHMCQEPCIDHGSQIYTYPASSEKEDKVQRSSRCQSLPLIIPQSNATNCNIQTSGMGRLTTCSFKTK